jgi:serine/threonine protein kinase
MKRTESGAVTAWTRMEGSVSPPRNAAEAFSPAFRERFEILGVLGEGGMGIVYRARQRFPDRPVAIKVMRYLSRQDHKRFLREAHIMGALRHPGVVRLHSAGTDGEIPYIISEFVDGGSLDSPPWAGPGPKEQVLAIAAGCVEALEAIHRAGFVHRDIKPSNILLGRDGRVRISDFGLSRALAPGGTITIHGAVLGSLAYMAPEQRAGLRAGPAADQYALAKLLWELWAGWRPPSDSSAVQPAIASLRPDIPEDVSEVLATGMQADPRDRYPSVAAFGAALEAAFTPAARRFHRSRRFPVRATVLLAILVAMLGWPRAKRRPYNKDKESAAPAKSVATPGQWRNTIAELTKRSRDLRREHQVHVLGVNTMRGLDNPAEVAAPLLQGLQLMKVVLGDNNPGGRRGPGWLDPFFDTGELIIQLLDITNSTGLTPTASVVPIRTALTHLAADLPQRSDPYHRCLSRMLAQLVQCDNTHLASYRHLRIAAAFYSAARGILGLLEREPLASYPYSGLLAMTWTASWESIDAWRTNMGTVNPAFLAHQRAILILGREVLERELESVAAWRRSGDRSLTLMIMANLIQIAHRLGDAAQTVPLISLWDEVLTRLPDSDLRPVAPALAGGLTRLVLMGANQLTTEARARAAVLLGKHPSP